MAAAATDLLKKVARRWVGQIGAGGVADASTTTIPLASTTNLPTDTAVVVTIDRVDANGTATASLEETVIGVVSGSNLVSCTRGEEGTAQAHSAGAVAEVLVTKTGINDTIDHLLVQHSQLGLHTTITASAIGSSTVTKSLSVLTGTYNTAEAYTPAGAGTATCNLALSNQHDITMPAGNITIALSNGTVGQKFIISITQDSVGSRTVTWFSTIKWAQGSAPTLTTTASKRDIFGFIQTGAATYDAFIIGMNL
uniref:Putative tail protein n=1 Tax=viral metagenome TaxID=1070528 RepID=A0A6M3IGI6_9ZZZZ